MTTFLLDVNVLIALIDPAHVQHEPAHEWFARVGSQSFATCPITENGLLRILGHPKYPNSPGAPAAVASLLAAMRALPGHTFWADKISVADEAAPTNRAEPHAGQWRALKTIFTRVLRTANTWPAWTVN